MNFDKKSLAAISLCIVFYIFYNQYLMTKYPDLRNPPKAPEIAESEIGSSNQNESGASTVATDKPTEQKPDTFEVPEEISKVEDRDLLFGNSDIAYELSQATAGFKSIILKNYEEEIGGNPINLVDEHLLLQAGTIQNSTPIHSGFNAQKVSDNSILFWFEKDGWKIEQKYTFPKKGFEVPIEFSWTNTTSDSRALVTAIMMQDAIKQEQADGGFLPGVPTGRPRLVVNGPEMTEWTDALEFCEEENLTTEKIRSRIQFVGFDKHYFLKSILPNSIPWSQQFEKRYAAKSGQQCIFTSVLSNDNGMVQPGEKVTYEMSAWFGPKVSDILEAYNPALTETLDLGWFGFISKPLWKGIDIVYEFFGNYGVAIILITLLLKIVFYPLTKQSAIAMHKTKKLQPEMTRIREKYKDDPRKQQQELMRFMSKHQINPMKGCLPMLPQIPVFFAFYRVLSTSIELRHAPFFGWITDLSASDPYYITPILLGVTMLVQQKLTPTTGMDKAQQRIMMMLPMFFTLMMLALPAGMVLYMLTNTIVSVGQQHWLNRRLDKLAHS